VARGTWEFAPFLKHRVAPKTSGYKPASYNQQQSRT
jgi:hypothetical protein